MFTTAVVVPTWLLAELVAAFFGIRGLFSGDVHIRVRSLGPRVRFSILGMLALIWLPQVPALLSTSESLPLLQVEIRNTTDSEISVSTR